MVENKESSANIQLININTIDDNTDTCIEPNILNDFNHPLNEILIHHYRSISHHLLNRSQFSYNFLIGIFPKRIMPDDFALELLINIITIENNINCDNISVNKLFENIIKIKKDVLSGKIIF